MNINQANRTLRRLALIISPIILLSIAATSRGQENQPGGDVVKQKEDTIVSPNKPSTDCVLRLDFVKNKVGSSEPIVLLIEFENLSGRTIVLTISDVEKIFAIKVEDANFKVMPLTMYGQRSVQEENGKDQFMRSIQKVKPGEKRSFKVLINRIYDMSIPGDYYVTAKKTFYVDKDQQTIDAISNVAKVKVGGFDASEKPNPKPTGE